MDTQLQYDTCRRVTIVLWALPPGGIWMGPREEEGRWCGAGPECRSWGLWKPKGWQELGWFSLEPGVSHLWPNSKRARAPQGSRGHKGLWGGAWGVQGRGSRRSVPARVQAHETALPQTTLLAPSFPVSVCWVWGMGLASSASSRPPPFRHMSPLPTTDPLSRGLGRHSGFQRPRAPRQPQGPSGGHGHPPPKPPRLQ